MEQRAIRITNLTNYVSIHSYLRRFKVGRCSKCWKKCVTHLALKHGKPHARKLSHYRELCPKCHRAYDRTPKMEAIWKKNLANSRTHKNPIQKKPCEQCRINFLPAKKSRQFCSNTCSQKSRVANLWLALKEEIK